MKKNKGKKISSDTLFTVAIVFLAVIIIALGVLLGALVIKGVSTEERVEPYSREKYYRMTSELTEDNIRFYTHDSELYLDDTFTTSVGAVYKREDSDDMYIVYKDKEYDLTDSDLHLEEVEVRTE